MANLTTFSMLWVSLVSKDSLCFCKADQENTKVQNSMNQRPLTAVLLLMFNILHYLKDPKLWELWYIPHYGQFRV